MSAFTRFHSPCNTTNNGSSLNRPRRSSLGSHTPTTTRNRNRTSTFDSIDSESLETESSSNSNQFISSTFNFSSPTSISTKVLNIKKTSSQPNLRQSVNSFETISSNNSKQNQNQITLESIQSNPHSQLDFTSISIPIRSSPQHSQPLQQHQLNFNLTSSSSSSKSSPIHQHQQHFHYINRHSNHHRASISAMTDESIWDEKTDIDIEDAQGGINGLLMNIGSIEGDEDDGMDFQTIDDEGSVSSKKAHNKQHQRDKSESCGSSAIGEVSGSGSGPMTVDSDSGGHHNRSIGAFGARMVRRRPVNRANLLPRPKAHLRVAAQLSTEDVSPDLLTEAEVHRRFRSVPFVVPPASTIQANNSPIPNPSPLIPHTPSSPFGIRSGLLPPPPNRFPEQVGPEDGIGNFNESEDSSDSSPEDQENFEKEIKSNLNFLDDQNDNERIEIQKWKKFRGTGSNHHGQTSNPTSSIFSPGSPDPSPARQHNQNLILGTSGSGGGGSPCASLARPAKRRFQDPERFDCSPNSSTFKRRAISPSASIAGSSSCLGSPVLHYLQPSPNSNSNPMNRDSSKDEP